MNLNWITCSKYGKPLKISKLLEGKNLTDSVENSKRKEIKLWYLKNLVSIKWLSSAVLGALYTFNAQGKSLKSVLLQVHL